MSFVRFDINKIEKISEKIHKFFEIFPIDTMFSITTRENLTKHRIVYITQHIKMKKLSERIFEAAKGLNIPDKTVNYVSKPNLEKYLGICDKFLSPEAKEVVNYLIDHNSTYVKDFTKPSGSTGNALADFYTNGVPKDAALKPLYKAIGTLVKKNNLMQVPVFQSPAEFKSILDKTIAPDEIFIDLTTEKGRNAVAKKYNNLVWKIAQSFKNKSTFTLDELYSIGLEGLTIAMNNYGKSQVETQAKKTKDKSEDELDEMIDKEKEAARKQYTFLSYAGYMIRIAILEAIKNESHLVRIPISQQNKERKETGKNTKSMSVSGDAAVGHDKDGNAKTLFDTVGDSEEGGRDLDHEDIEKLWKAIKKKLEAKFSEKTIGIFYDFMGLFGHEKLSGKEVMAKYHLKNPSEISNNNFKIFQYIKTDKALNKQFTELYTLYKECRAEEDADNDRFEPIYLNEKMNAFVNDRLDEVNNANAKDNDTDDLIF